MNNQLVKRMNTVGKVGKIITIVVIVLAIIASVAMTACAVFVSVLPEDTITAHISTQAYVELSDKVFKDVSDTIVKNVNDQANSVYDTGSVIYNVQAEKVDGDAVLLVSADRFHFDFSTLVPAIWIALFNCVAFIVCAFFFKGLMKELSIAQSPFTDGVVGKMKNFAIAILAASVATSIANAVMSAILSAGTTFAFNFNFGSIITAVIIFVLATVFRYGAQLQKESDETL